MKTFVLTLIASVVFFVFMQYEKSVSGNSIRNNCNRGCPIHASVKIKLQSGDVILRSGKGFISDVFRQLSSGDKKYSHAGIISIEEHKVFVYHILGGETKQGSQIRKELLDSFCAEKNNKAFAVYRYDLANEEKKNMLNNLQLLFSKKITFDPHFDLATDSAMYCTELVYKVVEAAVHDKKYLPYTFAEGNKYIALDNLYMNPHSKLIYSRTY
jgi:permuted papain-like amidase YaeF/Yiix C92 family enzyme